MWSTHSAGASQTTHNGLCILCRRLILSHLLLYPRSRLLPLAVSFARETAALTV